jgi:5-methyltetrahydropteroyltriglutamate--homocysteine methyltransferase
MRASTDRIFTTHVGSLQTVKHIDGTVILDHEMHAEVVEVVKQQKAAGIDFINEGELTKSGIWVTYVNERLGGFEKMQADPEVPLLPPAQDWIDFAQYYKDSARPPRGAGEWACNAPVTYRGQAQLRREINLLLDALGDTPASDAFLTSTAPLSLEPGRKNNYYKSQEEFLYAIADAISVEYEAIAKTGLSVQVDDAWLAALWDRIGIRMGLENYRRFCEVRVEVLNHALRNVPTEQVRYHLCWGSWPGPHSRDIPLKDIVDILLKVKAQMYLFEAANGRHEHEWTVWKDIKLADDKILAPGIVSHCTPVVEHPELVAERIQRFASIVGRERVVASTDCGLGIRCHPQVAWAKLKSLSEGAALASKALWVRRSAA